MLLLVTAPVDEILALDEVKEYLKVEHDEEDALIMSMIKGATKAAEEYTGRAFLTQTWDFILDEPPSEVYVPKPPLQSATVKITDDAGTETVVSASTYFLDLTSYPRIILKEGQTWGTFREKSGWKAQIIVGWTDVTLVPDEIKRAIKMLVAHAYEYREGAKLSITEAGRTTPYALLSPWRLIHI